MKLAVAFSRELCEKPSGTVIFLSEEANWSLRGVYTCATEARETFVVKMTTRRDHFFPGS